MKKTQETLHYPLNPLTAKARRRKWSVKVCLLLLLGSSYLSLFCVPISINACNTFFCIPFISSSFFSTSFHSTPQLQHKHQLTHKAPYSNEGPTTNSDQSKASDSSSDGSNSAWVQIPLCAFSFIYSTLIVHNYMFSSIQTSCQSKTDSM